YGCLAYLGPDNWTAMDRELIRLLLNSTNAEAYSDEGVAHLCYMVLEGRTRWPNRFPITDQEFRHVASLASYHIAEGRLDYTAELKAFDAMRFEIQRFRDQHKEITHRERSEP